MTLVLLLRIQIVIRIPRLARVAGGYADQLILVVQAMLLDLDEAIAMFVHAVFVNW